MPSPFPGMDPWLESRGMFPGFHNRFIANLSAAMNAVLPPPYFTDIGTRVVIESDAPDRLVEPDVDVLRPADSNGSRHPAGNGGVAVAVAAEPVIVHVPRSESTEWTIDVRTGDGDDQLITTIEMLSRSNKRTGAGREEYLKKQKEMVDRRVHVVELDFLRAGQHTTAVQEAALRRTAGPFDYHVSVWRADRPEDFEVYPILVARPLPPIAVPLTAGTPSLTIALKPVFDRTYDEASYPRRVKYDQPPDPPLTAEQAAWAAGVLREKGITPAPSEGP